MDDAACTFIIKETPAHSCFSVNSAEFLRIPFFEHSWVSASDFIFGIFKSNKYMKVSFLLTVFYRKSKIKQKSRLAPKLGHLRFALQWSSSFVEVLLSSCKLKHYTLKNFLETNWTKICFKERFASFKQMFGIGRCHLCY